MSAQFVAPRASLEMVAGYHSPQVDVAVRLNTNESPTAPPPQFDAALAARVADIQWHRYPDRQANDLRAAIADLDGVKPAQVFAANGSNEVLQSVMLAYGGPGRTAAVFEPTYALHSHISRVTGTDVAVGARTDDFAIDLAEVDRIFDDYEPTITFLCSPNNPTGTVDPVETTIAVLERVQATGGLLVVDEAYGQFAKRSAIELLGDDVPLVVTRTFSKTWALAAVRLGYALAPPRIIESLEKVVLPYHLDSMTQAAGVTALEFRDEMNARIASIVEERGRLTGRLEDLPVEVWPSGANFVLFRPKSADSTEVWQQLVDRSVLVRDCSNWPGLDGCLRITVGTPSDDNQFLDALTEVLT